MTCVRRLSGHANGEYFPTHLRSQELKLSRTHRDRDELPLAGGLRRLA